MASLHETVVKATPKEKGKVPEMGKKPPKALRGFCTSNRGSLRLYGASFEALRSGRIKHAPNRGFRFVSPSPPFS